MWTLYDFKNESGGEPRECRALCAVGPRERDRGVLSTVEQILFLVESARRVDGCSDNSRGAGVN